MEGGPKRWMVILAATVIDMSLERDDGGPRRAVCQPPNKQLQRTVTRRHGDGASAPFHYALVPRITRQRAAAELLGGGPTVVPIFTQSVVESVSWLDHSFVTLGGAMSLTFLYSSNALFRATLKTLVFGISSFSAIFCASAGYGLLKMLLPAFSGGATIGIAEFSTHSGLTILLFVLAGIGAYVAKRCFW